MPPKTLSKCEQLVVIAGSSGVLARQIEQGLSADIFVSAHPDWIKRVADTQSAPPAPLFQNQLVLVTNQPALSWTPSSLADYLANSPLVIGDPATVPLGQYGLAALKALLGRAPEPEQLVLAPSARHARALVERGGLSGILYASDTQILKGFRVIALPASSHPKIVYSAQVVSTDPERQRIARQLIHHLQSSDLTSFWEKFGFLPISH